MNRRHFLQTTSLVVPALWAGRMYAAPPQGPRLLVVFLRGGYDCLNVFVPQSSADYYEARPTIAIAKSPDLLQLDSDWALTPRSARRSNRCGMQDRSRSFRSRAPTMSPAATSRRRTA